MMNVLLVHYASMGVEKKTICAQSVYCIFCVDILVTHNTPPLTTWPVKRKSL